MKKLLWGLLLFVFALRISVAQSKPEEVVFPSDGRQLHGFLWKPEGAGPFEAIVWNHGSEKLPGTQPALANFYTAHSYYFLFRIDEGRAALRVSGSRTRLRRLLPASMLAAWWSFSRPRLTT